MKLCLVENEAVDSVYSALMYRYVQDVYVYMADVSLSASTMCLHAADMTSTHRERDSRRTKV